MNSYVRVEKVVFWSLPAIRVANPEFGRRVGVNPENISVRSSSTKNAGHLHASLNPRIDVKCSKVGNAYILLLLRRHF